MRSASRVAAVIFLCSSIYVMAESHRLQYYDELGPGPGFFPFWLGLVIALLSVIWLIQLRGQANEDMDKRFFSGRKGVLKVTCVVVALVAFTLVVGSLGYKLTMLIFLLSLLTLLGRQNLLLTAGIALLGSFGVFYAFNNWLGVPLPPASIELLQNWGL